MNMRFDRAAMAVAVAAIACLQAGAVLAQGAPDSDKETTAETPPAAAPAPATTTPTTAAAPAINTTDSAKAPNKKKLAKMTRQQEIDRSIERGTVPARYRGSVPKEYQQYIPFDKR